MSQWLKRQYETGTWVPLVGIAIVFLVVFVLGLGDGWAMVDLDNTAAQDIAQTFILLVFVALIVERATEALVAAWRPLGKARIERDIEVLKEQPETPALKAEIREKEEELASYRNRTRGITVAFGLMSGVFVAAVGIRMLEGIVASDALVPPGTVPDPEQSQAIFDELRRQTDWFRRLDIMLTGLVIAGGSQGIHKISKVFDSVLSRSAGHEV